MTSTPFSPSRFNARGQASLEFILVLVFMLVVVSGVIVPLGQHLQSALEDVSRVGSVAAGQSRIEADMNALLATPSEGLLVRDVFLPKGVNLSCDPVLKEIDFHFSLTRGVFRLDGSVPPSCTQNAAGSTFAMDCVKRLHVPANAKLTCQGSPAQSFTVDTGAAGFTQRFRIGSKYNAGAVFPALPFTIDFNAG